MIKKNINIYTWLHILKTGFKKNRQFVKKIVQWWQKQLFTMHRVPLINYVRITVHLPMSFTPTQFRVAHWQNESDHLTYKTIYTKVRNNDLGQDHSAPANVFHTNTISCITLAEWIWLPTLISTKLLKTATAVRVLYFFYFGRR